jgi:hypothetical protein
MAGASAPMPQSMPIEAAAGAAAQAGRRGDVLGRAGMRKFGALAILGLVLQACAMAPPIDRDAAFFAGLFDAPVGGSCRELRGELRAEIAAIKSAQQKADAEFITEQNAEPTPAPPPRLRPRPGSRNDPLASLRDVARRTKIAEDINRKLETRGCRAIDIEQALKAPAQSK